MSDVKSKASGQWTPEQWRAITERDCSLLVAAAAGAGKTAVLVERIIQRITDPSKPVDIDKLLVVTFTNAAAAEMRERIGDAISKALDAAPDSAVLQKQLTLLNKASITTIHSFCLEVIKNNFHCIELDPCFRIADETEATLLKLEALEELFDESYEAENGSEVFLKLVDCYGGGKDDGRLMDIVLELFEFVQSHPWPEQWLREASDNFIAAQEQDFAQSKWVKVLRQSLSVELTGIYSRMEKALAEIKGEPGLEPYMAIFQKDIETINTLIQKCTDDKLTWDELYRAFGSVGFDRLKASKKDADEVVKERVQEARKAAQKKIKAYVEDIFYTDSQGIAEETAAMHPVFNCLCGLVGRLGRKYSLKKRDKGIIDFNDLEHFCLEILADSEGSQLVPSAAALTYKERFDEIYIDEYQDSNLVQEVILNVISRKSEGRPNVFMVGDVKQSIYRFRQARPELFMEKYNRYSGDSSSNERKIKLFKNFRSRREVIDAVNYIFSQVMSVRVGELDYNSDEALNFGAFYEELPSDEVAAGGEVELHVVDVRKWKSSEAEPEVTEAEQEAAVTELTEGNEDITGEAAEEELPDLVRSEAKVAVKRISELLDNNSGGKPFLVFDKSLKKYRALEYRDIVILLRATQNWAGVFAEELSKQGIPAYADTGSGYFKTIEVATVMSLLQVIDNPLQDIPLLSVLRSPIAGFTPEELIDIRLFDREAPMYAAMQKAATAEGALPGTGMETIRKAGAFVQRLKLWRDKASYMSTDELIWFLYDDTGYYSFAGAMPGGVQRQANLRILFERARQYEQTSFKGLFNFINFINKLKSSKGDMGSAKILGENENVVRIMSIHKSKGLEFPVVLLAGTGKNFNLRDMNKKVLIHQDLGLGPDFVDSERRITYPTVMKQALRHKIKLESISEEMRILYVAFTRAKEKLIIIGSVNGMEKAAARWNNSAADGIKLPEYEVLRAKCYLDWIAGCLMRHKHGEMLRTVSGRHIGHDELFEGESSAWSVRLWSMEDIMSDRLAEAADAEELINKLTALGSGKGEEDPYMELVAKRLQWEYPYMLAEKLPTRLSVTELKRSASTEFAEEYDSSFVLPALVKRPRFMEESTELTAAEKGTAMHFVMQHLDLVRPLDDAGIKAQIAKMCEMELLTEQQAKAVSIRKINEFFKLPLGKRMLEAHRLYREVPFNIAVKCIEVFKELPADIYEKESIMLQGVIDCYFEEDGELVLLDYKTDYVAAGESDKVKEKYRTQLDSYAAALERITGKKVKEKHIYLFWNGELLNY